VGNNIEFYIKQLEAENEKLRASLDSALLTNDIEARRNIFLYEKWVTDKDGTIRLNETTLDKEECRSWIAYKHTDLIGYDNFILSIVCYAYKKDKNSMTARIVWDIEYEPEPTSKNKTLALCRMMMGRAYVTGGEYRKLKESSIRTKKYGE